jgi:hypothetical protein
MNAKSLNVVKRNLNSLAADPCACPPDELPVLESPFTGSVRVPVLPANRAYLRELRLAELAAWDANGGNADRLPSAEQSTDSSDEIRSAADIPVLNRIRVMLGI